MLTPNCDFAMLNEVETSQSYFNMSFDCAQNALSGQLLYYYKKTGWHATLFIKSNPLIQQDLLKPV